MLEKNIQTIATLLILQYFHPASFQQIIPQQIHISFGATLQEMVVTWITFADTRGSYVWYGEISKGLMFRSEGCPRRFSDGGTTRFIHKVTLTNLKPRTFYIYCCGSYYGVSKTHAFKVSPTGSNWSPRLVVFGDMGWQGSVAFPFIARESSDYDVDAILHVGDIAYNMDSCDGTVGDKFMRMIEPVASAVPYMTVVGNHEQRHNFTFYKNVFSMPGNSQGLFYSFDMGPAHFVAISTEVYYYPQYGIEPIINQYKWLKRDLKKASKAKNKRPWIIVFGHRPMYCSSNTGEDCSGEVSVLRWSTLDSQNYGLESLFHENEVNLYLSGHMHYYERSWPIYNKAVYNGSCTQPYTNPKALVQIITGAAGMSCGTESASYIRKDWFAFYSNEYSFTILTVYNKTHVHLEQVSAVRGGRVMDAIWLIKTR